MAQQFMKIGGTFFRQDDSGSMYAVSDPDTLTGLKDGHLPYNAIENNRGLSFSQPQASSQTQSSGATQPPDNSSSDIGSLIKNKLIAALTTYKGVTDVTELEQRRQGLLRKQLVSSPYSAEGESTLTGAQKLSLLKSRGAEFEPEIKSLEEQLLKAKQGDSESMSSLQKLVSLAKDAGIFGDDKHSPIYYEWKDAVGAGYSKGLNEYMTEDANRKAKAVGGDGLSASVLAKVTTIAQQHDSNQLVKDYNTIQNKSGSMKKILQSGVGGPGDLALVFEFMKALDPTSVVLETEYETAAKSGNIFAGKFAKFNGYLKEEGGFLPPQVQQAFISIMNKKLEVAQTQYDNYHSEQARKINKITGLTDGNDYLTDYGKVNFGAEENVETIRVKRNSDGATGTIPSNEFNSSKYTKI